VPEARKKSTLKALAGALIAAALVVAPLVTAGASAAPKDKPAAVLKGEIGVIEEQTPKGNDTPYWKQRYAAFDVECYKHSGTGSNEHGSVSADRKTVTLNAFQSGWHGTGWVVLVINAGTSNNVIENPKAGVAYASPVNNGGNQADVSHWIVCKGTTTPEVTPEVVTPSLDVQLPTCDAPGSVTPGTNADWTSVPNEDGVTVTWTALPKKGTVFKAGATVSWIVPKDLSRLTQNCEPVRPEKPAPTSTDKVKTTYDCNTDTATVTTTTTTTDYVWDEEAGKWVLGEPVVGEPVETTRDLTDAEEAQQNCPLDTTTEETPWVDGVWVCGDTTVEQTRTVKTTVWNRDETSTTTTETETQTRELTQEEIGTCPLVPGDIDAVCVGDVPYLGYGLTLPAGFVPSSSTPVTITFLNPDGEDYVVENQPLSGKLLWPGASAGEPKMWPGWELVNGEYVQTDGNFAWTREGVTVRFDVNPTYSTEVEYPEASAECANAPIGGPDGTPAGGLAVTGGGVSPIVVAAGGATLAAGIAVVAIAAYRRRRAAAE